MTTCCAALWTSQDTEANRRFFLRFKESLRTPDPPHDFLSSVEHP